jgi:Pyridoxamine 5'-phosphate oxidase
MWTRHGYFSRRSSRGLPAEGGSVITVDLGRLAHQQEVRNPCGVSARVSWSDFEAVAGESAVGVRALIENTGFVFMGTIRPDGSPRISPIEAHLVGPELILVMIPNTHKARDVLGDPRIVLHSLITSAADPGTEFKLRGRATVVADESQREAAAQQIEVASGWRPRPGWLFVALEIERVAVLEWHDDVMTLTRWDPSSGVQGPERRRLDLDAGTYITT